MASADPLARLARDRPLLTPEVHPPSDYYGYAHMLKRWAGWSVWRSLPAVAEHGVPLNHTIWASDLDASLPTLLCVSSMRAAEYEAQSHGGVGVPVGPPIAYGRSRGDEPLAPRGGRDGALLAFPAHSSHHASARFDVERFLEALESLRRRWSRVMVCLYWRDVLDGAATTYRERGFECVTAGHMYDRRFLPRLRAIIAASSGTVTNEVGSHLIYAVLMGRPTWIVPQDVDYVQRPGSSLDPTPQRPDIEAKVRALFTGEERREIAPEQREYIEEISGAGHVRSPEQLARVLREAQDRHRVAATFRQRARAQAATQSHLARTAAAFVVGRR